VVAAQRVTSASGADREALARSRAEPVLSRAGPTAMRGPAAVLALQRTAGNREVLRALGVSGARTLARCSGACTCGGACHAVDDLDDLSRAQAGRVVLARAVATDPDARATELLRLGSRGDAVSDVQARLSATGVECAVDGIFGARTQAAVELFQSAHRLVVDGIVGRETTAMLRRESVLHGGADRLAARGGAPCHTPDEPGPDDQTSATVQEAPTSREPGAGRLSLGFALAGPDGGGGGGSPAPTPAPAPAPDFVVNTSGDDPGALAPAGSTPVKVISSDDLRDKLKARKSVGRLVIVGHAAEGTGDVLFDAGTARELIPLADLARKLRGVATVQQIDFVSCSVGSNLKGLEEVRDALGAVSASGYTCHMEDGHAGPLTADGVAITTEAQYQALSPAGKKAYDDALRARAGAKDLHGDCLVDAPPGKKLAQISKDELREFAMRRGGVLRTFFAKEDGTCGKDMKFGGTEKCRRVQAK